MYLLHLLGVQDGQEALAHLSPDAIKARTFATLRQLCFDSSRQQPLVLAVEDLHWVDATTEEFLAYLVEYLPGTSVMVLTTYRPGYRPPWFDRSYMTQIALMQLTSGDSLQVVQSVLHQANSDRPILNTCRPKRLSIRRLAIPCFWRNSPRRSSSTVNPPRPCWCQTLFKRC